MKTKFKALLILAFLCCISLRNNAQTPLESESSNGFLAYMPRIFGVLRVRNARTTRERYTAAIGTDAAANLNTRGIARRTIRVARRTGH